MDICRHRNKDLSKLLNKDGFSHGYETFDSPFE